MILALVGSNHSATTKAKEFLTARSFVPLELEQIHDPGVPTDRHLLVLGVKTSEDFAKLQTHFESRSARVKLVFIGSGDELVGAGKALFTAAELCAADAEDESLERLSISISRSMADFKRPSWDEYFMNIARVVATRSNCMKRSVAAVVVKEKQILATGYNGTPRGAVNCNEGGCPRCNSLSPTGADLMECLCNHAEENAITQAAYHGIPLRGTTMYCTLFPCLHCTKLIINAGIREVVYDAAYPTEEQATALFTQCGVEIRRFSSSELK